MTTTTATHIFERAGLGLAPFRVVGFEHKTFQACPGAPIQCGGSCDYCSNAISHFCWIASADGNRFKVGCDCVKKTGDRGLRAKVDAFERQADRAKRAAKAIANKSEVAAALTDPATRAALATVPHYNPSCAARGMTALDACEWMLARAGAKGIGEAAKMIRRAGAKS